MEKNQKQRLSPRQLVKLCVDASAGMAYLEDKNCIHRWDIEINIIQMIENTLIEVKDVK